LRKVNRLRQSSIRKKSSDEQALVAHVGGIAGHDNRGWAAHLRTSWLAAESRHQNLMFAMDQVRLLATGYNGVMYGLQTGDLVCVFRDARIVEIKKKLDNIQLLFRDDPLFLLEDGNQAAFIAYYNLSRDFAEFEALAKHLLGQARDGSLRNAAPAERAPLDSSNIGQAAAALGTAELAQLVRRQTVYLVANGAAPLPVFDEIFVSIADLEQRVVPGVRLAADRWLFQHLTRILDRKMIELLRAGQQAAPSDADDESPALRAIRNGGCSLNFNVSSVLSPEFQAFDAALPMELRRAIVLEFQKIDAFADLGSFLYARDYLHDRGFRVALDGVSHLSLPFVDRAGLGIDLVKLMWVPDMAAGLAAIGRNTLREVIERTGADRVILCRCDSAQAIECGQSLGLLLFQGWHLDKLSAAPSARRSA